MELHVVVTYGGVIGRLARRFGLRWNHAALRYARSPQAGLRIIESSACGAVERSWEDFLKDVEEYQAMAVREGLSEMTMREIIAYGWGNVGKPYNYWWFLKIAWQLLKRRLIAAPFTYPAHVCSSLVYDCFRYAGVNLLPGHEGVLVTPDDLAGSPLLEVVETGKGA